LDVESTHHVPFAVQVFLAYPENYINYIINVRENRKRKSRMDNPEKLPTCSIQFNSKLYLESI